MRESVAAERVENLLQLREKAPDYMETVADENILGIKIRFYKHEKCKKWKENLQKKIKDNTVYKESTLDKKVFCR